MNKNYYSEFYAESWHFQEWCNLNRIDCKNIKIGDSVIDSIRKRHKGPAIYFLKPQSIFLLAKELKAIGNKDFLADKQLVCGAGWHDSLNPYQNDIVYFFEYRFEEWANLSKVFPQKILLLADGIPSTKILELGVFDLIEFNFEFLFYANTYLESLSQRTAKKDFLYLIMEKQKRSHRDFIYFMLKEDKEFANSVCLRNKRNNKEKFKDLLRSYGNGLYELGHSWYDRYPSLGYYQDTNFEIVGETLGELGNDAFFPTEKIIKPIIMKHPFVVAGTKGYLRNLKSFGFRSFDNFIDETYDDIHNWQDRMKAVVEVVRKIIRSGSDKFYKDTREICEHNYEVLCDLQGRHKNILWTNMKVVMEKLNEN